MLTVGAYNDGMRVLLVYPRFPTTYWGFQYGLSLVGRKAALPPLGLITVAALLPKTWSFRLVDLNIEDLQDRDVAWADVVLTGGMLIQTESTVEIIRQAWTAGRPVVVGGPAATTDKDRFLDADLIFQGEVEGRSDALIAAIGALVLEGNGFETRHVAQVMEFQGAAYPAMELSPIPRFDLLDVRQYASLSLQFSRGCPFRCEFCNVIEIFGRKPRVKSTAQVLAELAAIHACGYDGSLFLVDDNFIGNRPAVRQLLPHVATWQRDRGRPFDIYTEASVNLAEDDVLLGEMIAAGFGAVFVGLETPSEAALAGANKPQNLRLSLEEAVGRITAAGLEVMGGFIVGFDEDDPGIFAAQRRFVAAAPIPLAMIGMLTALPGTALERRLRSTHRLREHSTGDQFGRPNFAPTMDEEALLSGYRDLMAALYTADAYYARCEAHVAQVGDKPRSGKIAAFEVRALFTTLLCVGIISPRRRHLWRLLWRAAPRGLGALRWAIGHAVMGEHMIRYTKEDVLPRLEAALAEVRGSSRMPRPGLAPTRTAASAPALDGAPVAA